MLPGMINLHPALHLPAHRVPRSRGRYKTLQEWHMASALGWPSLACWWVSSVVRLLTVLRPLLACQCGQRVHGCWTSPSHCSSVSIGVSGMAAAFCGAGGSGRTTAAGLTFHIFPALGGGRVIC